MRFQKSLCRIISVYLTIYFILFSCINDVCAAEAPSESTLYSQSCAVCDGYSGRILYEKNGTDAKANASTTKILTCILALEYGTLSDTVTASARAAGQPKVHLGMTEGQEFVLEDLLYCLMLESYNDCAVTIAEHISGSVEAFADLMNEKALEIGCEDTYFLTPNGLDNSDDTDFHHTTAADLCQIMRYCAWNSPQSEMFLTITRTANYTFTDGSGVSHSLTNRNTLLTTMDGALTGKTGYTNDAGYCYVMAYEKDGKRFCAALLACGWPNNKTYKWKDAATLMEYVCDAYDVQEIYRAPDIPTVSIADSCPPDAILSDWQKTVSFTPVLLLEDEPELLYMISEADEITYEIHFMPTVRAPLTEGKIIGSYEIAINGEVICEYALCAPESAYQWNLQMLLRAVLQAFLL